MLSKIAIALACLATVALAPPAVAQWDPPGTPASSPPPATISATPSATLRTDAPGPTVSRYIFSQFAEHLGAGIYGGLWVGANSRIPNTRGYRNDVIAALRGLKVPLVRWPGGCFGDTYHWRDGIGPRAKRPSRLNTYWNIVEPNTFGTHEFMEFVDLIGAEAYVNGNVGSSHPGEMAEWVEYMTARVGGLAEERARNGRKEPWKVAYWGIGNELWGCGGQMRAEFAADLTRQFGQFIKVPEGTKPLIVGSGANVNDYNWTDVMMRETGSRIDALALHYYTIPDRRGARGSGTDFDEAAYARTLYKTIWIDELIKKHAAIMDKYDPAKRVNLAVDEWGLLTDIVPGYPPQSLFMQNSLRDGILTALNFDIFVRHAARVRMTAIAQMINVAQAMILTKEGQMILTPTYHVYEMYKAFHDATAMPLEIKSPWYSKDQWGLPAVSGSAVRNANGTIHVALTNVDPNRAMTVPVTIAGARPTQVSGRILTAARGVTAHNDFGAPDVVTPQRFDGASISGSTLTVILPPHSVVVLDLR